MMSVFATLRATCRSAYSNLGTPTSKNKKQNRLFIQRYFALVHIQFDLCGRPNITLLTLLWLMVYQGATESFTGQMAVSVSSVNSSTKGRSASGMAVSLTCIVWIELPATTVMTYSYSSGRVDSSSTTGTSKKCDVLS